MDGRDIERYRTLGELVEALARPRHRADADQRLLADAGFAARYAARAHGAPDASAAARCAPGTLGAEYLGFLAHYELPPRFFPVGARDHRPGHRPGPCEYAAGRLAEMHDLFHVIGEYETSDMDEVAIQSFMAGQAPVALALFLRAAWTHPDAATPPYRHLRMLVDGPISWPDVARGRRAALLLGLDAAAELNTPVTELRARLGVAPRAPRTERETLRNTCGGVDVGPYFAPQARSQERP